MTSQDIASGKQKRPQGMEHATHPTANLSVLQNYHPTHPSRIILQAEKPVNKKISLTGPPAAGLEDWPFGPRGASFALEAKTLHAFA